MGQDLAGEDPQVVGEHVVAARQRGARLGGAHEVEGGARRGAQGQLVAAPGRRRQGDGVALHRVGDVDLADDPDQLADLGGVGDRLEVLERVALGVGVEHRDLGRLDGVADRESQHEAVALGLGEGVGALHLDGVLGRDDHEGRLEVVRRVVDGDLVLLHALQQRGLGLGRRAVDLVADHDVGEHAAGAELELAGVLVEHRHARHVGGQQVGRELDAAHRALDAARQGLAEHGLADAGHVLDEDVALGEQADEHRGDDVGLALDHPLDVGAHPLDDPAEGLEVGAAGRAAGVPRPACPVSCACSRRCRSP